MRCEPGPLVALSAAAAGAVRVARGLSAVAALALLLSGCARPAVRTSDTVPDPAPACPAAPSAQATTGETGLASWYGKGLHGRMTASGEIFDKNALTAAHPSLPMSSDVRVTNLENGRALVLRVNDRGPRHGGRIIDVSRRAAQLLGFEKAGTTQVRVEAMGADSGQASAPNPIVTCASPGANGPEPTIR